MDCWSIGLMDFWVTRVPTLHYSNNPSIQYPIFCCGAERDRTAGLHVANVALSQLSYCPGGEAKSKLQKEKGKQANLLLA